MGYPLLKIVNVTGQRFFQFSKYFKVLGKFAVGRGFQCNSRKEIICYLLVRDIYSLKGTSDPLAEIAYHFHDVWCVAPITVWLAKNPREIPNTP